MKKKDITEIFFRSGINITEIIGMIVFVENEDGVWPQVARSGSLSMVDAEDLFTRSGFSVYDPRNHLAMIWEYPGGWNFILFDFTNSQNTLVGTQAELPYMPNLHMSSLTVDKELGVVWNIAQTNTIVAKPNIVFKYGHKSICFGQSEMFLDLVAGIQTALDLEISIK